MSAEYLSHSEARAIGSVVVDKPAGTLPGMLLIAVGFNYHFGQTPTIAPPAGWTERGVRTTIHHCYYVWTRLAEAGEPATYTFTTASDNQGSAEADATILIGAYRKVRIADPLHVVGVASTETGSDQSHRARHHHHHRWLPARVRRGYERRKSSGPEAGR